jgi:hypothetical protein
MSSEWMFAHELLELDQFRPKDVIAKLRDDGPLVGERNLGGSFRFAVPLDGVPGPRRPSRAQEFVVWMTSLEHSQKLRV